MKKCIVIIIIQTIGLSLYGQNFNTIPIDASVNGSLIKDYLKSIEETNNVDFIFDENAFGNFSINGITTEQNILTYLAKYFSAFDLNLVQVKPNVVLILPRSTVSRFYKSNLYIVLKKSNDAKTILKGEIFDSSTDEILIGAQLIVEGTNSGALSEVDGTYSIDLNNRIPLNTITVKYIGYDSFSFLLILSEYGDELEVVTKIFPNSTQLEDVIISATKLDRNVSDKLTGVQKLGIESIKLLPSFMGEIDPVRGITTLPGVSAVGELSSGFNVRGGDLGQNLIRQDGAIIINPSHLFGFYSAFNPDLVAEVNLIKGGGNAKNGSRVSSIMDVSLRNGDTRKLKVSAGIGLISSRLTIEGPLKKNKSSFIIGGRGSYTNWLLEQTKDLKLTQSSANFGDITAKVFQLINDKNFVSVSGYSSYDNFNLGSDSTFQWTTNNISLKWGHTFNETTDSHLTLAGSQYITALDNSDEIDNFIYKNGSSSGSLSYDIDKSFSENKSLNFGIEGIYTLINPGKLENQSSQSNTKPFQIDDHNALETAAYVHYEWDITDEIAISTGLRYSQFYRIGNGVIYDFNYNVNESIFPELIDTLAFSTGELIDFQHGLEPRLSMRYIINNSTSVKASFYKTNQYLHLISNTTSSTPLDYWLSSGPNLLPEIGNQFSLGFFRNSKDNNYEISIEGFYRNTKNPIDYIEGADIKLTESIEGLLIQGKGIAYGTELLARKNRGKLNGWVSYTYSRSLRQFNSQYEVLKVNNGKYYASQYDQPHNLSVVLNYKYGPILSFSANFNFSSGRPITIPTSKFSYDAYLSVLNYSDRNEYRVPDYHRLDISATLKNNIDNKKFRSEWNLSIFNIYSRNNAYTIFFNQYGSAKKVSILGNAFPSLTYNFKF